MIYKRGRAGAVKRVALRRQWLSAYAGSNPVVRIRHSHFVIISYQLKVGISFAKPPA